MTFGTRSGWRKLGCKRPCPMAVSPADKDIQECEGKVTMSMDAVNQQRQGGDLLTRAVGLRAPCPNWVQR